MTEIDDRQQWINSGWSRGAFIDIKATPKIAELLPKQLQSLVLEKDQAYLTPLLYDCALISEKFHQEPWVQVLVCWPCEQENGDGNFKFGKNPRKINFPIIIDGIKKYFNAEAIGFAQISRQKLLTAAIPLINMRWPEKGLFQLLNWVAERYNQPTFPDQWNKRIAVKSKQLSKLWKSEAFVNNCSGIYFNIEPFKEILETENYQLKAYIVLPSTLTGKEHRIFVKEHEDVLIQKLRDTINSISNIAVIEIDTIKEDEFTKSMERDYCRWQLEHLSYKDLDNAPLPAELEINND